MRSDMGIGLYFWQPELTIFDDSSPLYLLVADPDGPDGQTVNIPRSARRFTDREDQLAVPVRAPLYAAVWQRHVRWTDSADELASCGLPREL